MNLAAVIKDEEVKRLCPEKHQYIYTAELSTIEITLKKIHQGTRGTENIHRG